MTSVRLVPKTGGNVAGLPRGIVVQVIKSGIITVIEVNNSTSSNRYLFCHHLHLHHDITILPITQAPGQTTGVQRVMVVQKSGDGRTIMAVHSLFLKAEQSLSYWRTLVVIVDFIVDSSGETGNCVNKQPGHHHQLRHMDSHLHHGWTFSFIFLKK